MKRREFLKLTVGGLAAAAVPQSLLAAKPQTAPPNVILIMSDDQGWGDTGYNGHKILKTPNLDAMSGEGVRFDRWYAGAPVCSPTRGSCLTGRHPFRYGVFYANVGHMRKQEITLAEALKTRGYATGHFGKWHLGTLTRTVKDGRRGGPNNRHYSPPWENGFDACFATEQAIPTWDPMKNQNIPTKYWIGPGKTAKDNLDGDDSRVIMDRAIPFIEKAAKAHKPFFAVIWFHAPHAPVVAGPRYRRMYDKHSEGKQHYFGCITAMDEQIGRLRKELKGLGVSQDTMVWFCSDNGPEGRKPQRRSQGSAGPFRGRKRSLFEGGIRVPGLLVWPARIKKPRVAKVPCCTSDYFPTILDILGFKMPKQPLPMDGVSLKGLIEGQMAERPRPIGFESRRQVALIDNRYKIHSGDGGKTWKLFDLQKDPGEQNDLAAGKPEILKKMAATVEKWRASCKASLDGKDYE